MGSKRSVAPPTMTPQEIDIITRYGETFRELLNGERPPKTPVERHFIDACRARVKPTSRHEIAFIKYLLQQRWDSIEKRRRQELRDKKAAAKKRAKLAALEIQNERKRDQISSEAPSTPSTPAAGRKKRKRENPEFYPPPEIPEYEEGYPRPGWFTDEDWKKLRSRYP